MDAATTGEPSLPLVRVTLPPLVLAPIRLALGVVGLVAARVAGADDALLAFAVGGLAAAAFLMGDPRRRGVRAEPTPVPPRVHIVGWREIARTGIFPSTVGVAGLALASLFFNATLAALLAGILGGMAVATAVAWIQAAQLERRYGSAVFVERGGRRLYIERP